MKIEVGEKESIATLLLAGNSICAEGEKGNLLTGACHLCTEANGDDRFPFLLGMVERFLRQLNYWYICTKTQ